MNTFSALNTQQTHTLSFHVLKDNVPVAVLSNHKWAAPDLNSPQRWTLYRLSDHKVISEPEQLMTPSEAKDFFSCLDITEDEPKFIVVFDTAFGLKLFYSDDRYGLTPIREKAREMPREEAQDKFDEEYKQHHASSIPGDWIKSCRLVSIATQETVRFEMVAEKRIPLYHAA